MAKRKRGKSPEARAARRARAREQRRIAALEQAASAPVASAPATDRGATSHALEPTRPPWRPRLEDIRWTHTSGPLGLGLAICLVIGMNVAWPLAAASVGTWIGLLIREIVNGSTALKRLARAFPDAERDGDTQLRGTCDGVPFVVFAFHESFELRTTVAGVSEFSIARGASRVPIGDPAFDAAFEIAGDPLAWRLALTSRVRELFVEELPRAELGVRGIVLELSHPTSVKVLERCIRASCEIAAAIASALDADSPDSPAVDDRRAALLASIPREPIAALRRSHYEWLLAAGHADPVVFLAASRDVDPEIADWARQHLPPELGAFR